jgi:hypothetical protein
MDVIYDITYLWMIWVFIMDKIEFQGYNDMKLAN